MFLPIPKTFQNVLGSSPYLKSLICLIQNAQLLNEHTTSNAI